MWVLHVHEVRRHFVGIRYCVLGYDSAVHKKKQNKTESSNERPEPPDRQMAKRQGLSHIPPRWQCSGNGSKIGFYPVPQFVLFLNRRAFVSECWNYTPFRPPFFLVLPRHRPCSAGSQTVYRFATWFVPLAPHHRVYIPQPRNSIPIWPAQLFQYSVIRGDHTCVFPEIYTHIRSALQPLLTAGPPMASSRFFLLRFLYCLYQKRHSSSSRTSTQQTSIRVYGALFIAYQQAGRNVMCS